MEEWVARLGRLIDAGELELAGDLVAREAEPVRRAVGEAAMALTRRDATSAVAHAEAARRMAPEVPVVLQYAALAQLVSGDAAAAELLGRQAVNRDPTPRSAGALGNLLLAAGKLDDAEEAYRRALDQDPNHVQSLNGVATIRARRNDQATAVTYLARAIEAAPSDEIAMRNLVELYSQAGWALGAMTLAKASHEGYHGDDVLVALSLLLLRLGQLVQSRFPDMGIELRPMAEDLAERSATRAPALQAHAARALIEYGFPELAQNVVNRLSATPVEPAVQAEVSYLRGLLFERAGREADALAEFEAAADANPACWEAVCNAIHLLLARSDAESLGRVDRLLAATPEELLLTRTELVLNRAVYHRRIGRVADAHHGFERALRLSNGEGPLAALARQGLSAIQ